MDRPTLYPLVEELLDAERRRRPHLVRAIRAVDRHPAVEQELNSVH
jgi:hypothetical protein